MNIITKTLNAMLTNFIQKLGWYRLAKENDKLNILKFRTQRLKQQLKSIQVVNQSLLYCSNLPANNPNHVSSKELEPIANFLFNCQFSLIEECEKLEKEVQLIKINQLKKEGERNEH